MKSQNFTLDIVGSSTFGRDPKILSSRTFNMIIADDWLVDYAGYNKEVEIDPNFIGRGIFPSIKLNRLIAVYGNKVYSIGVFSISSSDVKRYDINFIGNINTFNGSVSIAENNANQIAICDQDRLYIYNFFDGTFLTAILPEGFIPGYVAFQNGYFISPDLASSLWALSALNNGLNWFWDASGNPVLGSIQTKPDLAQAAIPFPGRGNLLLVFGKNVAENWTDVGNAIFPYQKNTSINFDYGCISSATIASSDNIVAWLGKNEKSGIAIMFTTGSEIEQLSTDGINNKLSQINKPESSSAFFVKLAGHLIYQLAFYDPSDNFSLIYDFTTKKFFDVTDEYMNFHIAREVAYFDNDYYFVSYRNGNLYKMSASQYVFDYGIFQDDSPKIFEIPRVRVCSNIRFPDSSRFIVNKTIFTMEQGNDIYNDGNHPEYQPRIGLSVSVNGGISFGSYDTKSIYPVAIRPNSFPWFSSGSANDFVHQFRYWGRAPWRATNGTVSVYQ